MRLQVILLARIRQAMLLGRHARQLLSFLRVAVLCGMVPAAVQAQATAPSPQVAGDMHVGPVSQIRGSPDGLLLLTIGADKTLRIWRTEDLAPVRTVHLPSDAGNEGDPRSLAISPDGRQVYVGGWTGLDWHSGRSQVYVFDIDTGAMRQVWRGQPGVVASMALSRDGRQLALGLSRALRVLDTRDGSVRFEDTQYAGPVGYVDFAPDGQLATVSDDGCVRVYSPALQLRFRAAYPPPPPGAAACPGGKPGGIRFSPDGQRLAFGLVERPEVVVMDVPSLSVLRSMVVSDPGQKGLCCISWSKAGDILTVYGEHERSEQTPLYRVDQAGLGVARRFDVGRHALTNSLPLDDGGMIVATDTPRLMRLDAQGRTLATAEPPNGDFRKMGQLLRASADGSRVAFTLRPHAEPLVFTLGAAPDRALLAAPQGPPAELSEPLRSGPLKVTAELGRFSYLKPMRIGGVNAPMSAGESLYSWAGHARREVVVLGTGWAVKLADARGRALWSTTITSPAYSVNLTEDGRWVVAALGDGTLRWLDAATGREVLGLFVHLTTQEWVAWRPDGYYASSPRGDEYFGWRINRSDDQAADLLRAVQFERQLFRPELLAQALQVRGADAQAKAPGTLAAVIAAAAVPRVRVVAPVDTGRGTYALQVQVEAAAREVRELGVFVDGLPVLPATARARRVAPGERANWRLEVPRPRAGARVRVEAETVSSIGHDETVPVVDAADSAGTVAPRRGRLWALVVGVSNFSQLGTGSALPGALNDATALARTLSEIGGGWPGGMEVILLSERSTTQPSKAAILSAVARISRQAQPDDTVLVFVASHGMPDAGEYYIATRDTTLADVNRLDSAFRRQERVTPGMVPSMISGTELVEALRRAPGRRLVVLDTCFSGLAGNGADPFVMVKRSASAQLAVISAASGDELSLESPELGHGIFTYMLMKALRREIGPSDTPLTLRTLFDTVKPAVVAEVNRLRNAQTTPAARQAIGSQTPMMTAIPILESTVFFPSAR